MADFGDFNIQLDSNPIGDSERAEKEKKITFENSEPKNFSSAKVQNYGSNQND